MNFSDAQGRLERLRLRLAEYTLQWNIIPARPIMLPMSCLVIPRNLFPLSQSMTNFRRVDSRRILRTPLRKFPSSASRPCSNTSAWTRLPPPSAKDYSRTPHGTSNTTGYWHNVFPPVRSLFTSLGPSPNTAHTQLSIPSTGTPTT
jgi:hypothetical protein